MNELNSPTKIFISVICSDFREREKFREDDRQPDRPFDKDARDGSDIERPGGRESGDDIESTELRSGPRDEESSRRESSHRKFT